MANTGPWGEETVKLEGPFGASDLQSLRAYGDIECLSLTKEALVTAKIAKGLSALSSVHWLFLWCPTTRTAMRHVISIPGLEILDVFEIRRPGALAGFAEATGLMAFRSYYLSEDDLLEVLRLPNLEELGAQSAAVSSRVIDSILRRPKLRKLDLECSDLDDRMAAALASSETIEELDVGASRITREGLRSLCAMTQLRALDIWALDIEEGDLDLLSGLPNLEYLSIGPNNEQSTLTANGVLPRLAALPSLKRIWLDGIPLSSSERRELEERYDYVRT